jgi:hypothetical protein
MRLLIVLLLSLLASIAFAQRQVTTIEVNYADPEQVAEVIQSYLSAGSSVRIYRKLLILNATPEELDKTRELLLQLDSAGRQLLISVRSDGAGSDSHGSVGVNTKHKSGNTVITTGPGSTIGTDISNGRVTESSVTVRTSHSQSTRAGRGDQSIRATEGIAAYISTGMSAPTRSYSTGPDGRRYYQQDYVEAVSGFYATSWVNDGVVQISIDQSNDQYERGTIQTQQLQSQVSGALGQWLPIGVVNTTGRQQDQGIGSYGQSSSASSTRLYLKVELLE